MREAADLRSGARKKDIRHFLEEKEGAFNILFRSDALLDLSDRLANAPDLLFVETCPHSI